MMIRTMSFGKLVKLVVLSLILSAFTVTTSSYSQNVNLDQLNELATLSDTELLAYWQQAQAQGYTIEQIKAMAVTKGISDQQIAILERRLRSLMTSDSGEQTTMNNPLSVDDSQPTYLTGYEQEKAVVQDSLFGYSFFNNPNISFAPNLNLATPETYVLGPADQLAIGIWGAAENNYYVSVDRQGAVRIPNVGPIFVSGLSIKDATKKIKSALKRLYSGLSASESSPYYVGIDVAVVEVRTVQVNIIGEVKVPGTYSLSALSSVLNGLYASGGPTRSGTLRNVKLIRNGEEAGVFDVYSYLLTGSQEGNLNLRDGDIILVQPFESQVEVYGPVKREGIFELRQGETFEDLFRFTSGFKSDAYKDVIVLERIEDDRRTVIEIPYAQLRTEQPMDGDRVRVKAVIDKFENAVSIDGAVYRPGVYQYSEGLKLSELINKASGTLDQVFLERGLIISTKDGIRKSSRSFSPREILEGVTDVELQPNDEVILYDKYALQEEAVLIIDGEVNNPTTVPYIENLSLEDLILMAGGFKQSANPKVIDVFRRVNDDSFETLAESISVSAQDELMIAGSSGFILAPNDRIAVRGLKGFEDRKNVVISGEVNLAGSYMLTQKNQRISDLVERAGGLSNYAYKEGASLVRKNPYYKDKIQTNVLTNIQDSTAIQNLDLNNRESFKVGIDLKRILADGGKGSKYDLILEDGDILIIPSSKETIKIEGEVLAPSMVRFDENYTALDYINRSGGFSNNAKRGKTYVIYANGDIASTKRFLFFKSYPRLKPGAIILVPTKPKRKPLTLQEGVAVTSGLATLALLIDSLFN